MSQLVVALAGNSETVRQIARRLKEKGVNDLSILVEGGQEDLRDLDGLRTLDRPSAGRVTSAALRGGAVGAVASGATMAVPFVGPFVFAGSLPFASAAGAVVGAANGQGANDPEAGSSDVAGSLRMLGIPETEVPRFETALHAGSYLIAARVASTETSVEIQNLFEQFKSTTSDAFETAG